MQPPFALCRSIAQVNGAIFMKLGRAPTTDMIFIGSTPFGVRNSKTRSTKSETNRKPENVGSFKVVRQVFSSCAPRNRGLASPRSRFFTLRK